MFVLVVVLRLQYRTALVLSPPLSNAPDDGYNQAKKDCADDYHVNGHEESRHGSLIVLSAVLKLDIARMGKRGIVRDENVCGIEFNSS
jgi:hypothetical protein